MSFVRGPNPIWFMSNLTGQPLDDTYYAFFLNNELPYNPQAVYQDPNGVNPWSNPIEFQPSSGLPNNLYFDPDLVYRIEIRQGDSQTDPLIWLVQNYTVGDGSITPFVDSLIFAENMITNPQFADINFVSPLVITTAGTHDIAPGWQLVTTGIGSTTITQIPIAGQDNPTTIGNPPYSLTFANSSWSSVKLVQQFDNNGAIFGHGAIALAFTAYSTGADTALTVSYQPSIGPGFSIFTTPPIPAGGQVSYQRAINIPKSLNSSTGQSAYVNIEFVLPTSGIITLTDIQITGQSRPLSSGFLQSDAPIFQEQTYERIVDHEFHVYKDSILMQPKETLLTGWNFGLNPWQFRTTAITNVGTNDYTADQTIVVQQSIVAAGPVNNIAVGQATFSENYAFQVNAVTVTSQFALIQYIDTTTIAPYWTQNLSAMVRAKIASLSGAPKRFKVKLIYRNSLPLVIGANEPIATWLAGGEPVFSLGWSSISPLNDPTYTLTSSYQNFEFNKFQLPVANSNNMILGIVIYMIDPLSIAGTPDSLFFDKVSLVHNDFSIESTTETFDQSLRKCQFYYEKSYNLQTLPSTATAIGAVFSQAPCQWDGTNTNVWLPDIYLQFKQQKRVAINPVFYTISGAANGIQSTMKSGTVNIESPINVPIGDWAIFSTPHNSILYSIYGLGVGAQHPGFVIGGFGELLFHYVVDARLGK